MDSNQVLASLENALKTMGVGKLEYKDCSVIRDKTATQIIMPENMSPHEGIHWLTKYIKHLDEEVSPHIPVRCYPYDGLVAFHRALKRIFGFVSLEATQSFFGSEPPAMINVATSATESVQVPIGRMRLQTIDGYVEVMPGMDNGKPALIISGKVKRKSLEAVNALAEETKEELKTSSIYKGKAIVLGRRSDEQTPQEKFFQKMPGGMASPPEFMQSNGLKKQDIILNRTIEQQIDHFLWTPIEQASACRRAGIPLKRGILLSGSYGTGKSMTASITAEIAIQNNWTFVHLVNSNMLPLAIEIAKWYQPAVIFTEDIDAVMGDERDERINNILNVVDGVDKKREIFVVLTTNHIENINKAFLRPGRLDAIIEFKFPDSDAAARLMQHYGRGLIPNGEDLTEPASIIAGAPASMVQEAVERAKLSAIARSGTAKQIIASDLVTAAKGLQTHLALLNGEPDKIDDEMRAVGELMVNATAEIGRRLKLGKVSQTDDSYD